MNCTKHIVKSLSILLSTAFIVSCNDKIDTPEYSDTSNRIIVKTEVEGQTKAGYEGTTTLPSEFEKLKQCSDEELRHKMQILRDFYNQI